MNVKKYILAVIAAYVAMAVVGIGSDSLLMPYYDSFNAISRPLSEMEAMMPVFLLAYLLQTFVFCYIYVKGRESGTAVEGLRYGAIIGVFVGLGQVVLSTALPLSVETVVAGFIAYMVIYAIGGLATALVYKPKTGQSF
jgi:tryptophan-rich sensory protein